MAMRKPTGDKGVGAAPRWASAASALSRVVLRRLTRRSTGARSASALPSSAAEAPKLASNCGASHSGKSPATCGGAPRALGVGERRRRVALARKQRRNGRDVEAAGLAQRAENLGARRRLAHDPGGRAFPSERVINEARDRSAVAGAGEAMRKAPVLHRVGRRPTPDLDVGKNFDCGGGARGGSHGIEKAYG